MHPLKKKKKRVLAGKSLGVHHPFNKGGRRRGHRRERRRRLPSTAATSKTHTSGTAALPSDETWDQKALREWQLEQDQRRGATARRFTELSIRRRHKICEAVRQGEDAVDRGVEADFAEEKEVTWTDRITATPHWVRRTSSRQVSDGLKTSRSILEDYNEKLRFVSRKSKNWG